MGDPRAERTRSSTLDAAFQLLGDEGVQGATVERIAECAGVHKTTVYRHWPERVALLAEALETDLLGRIPLDPRLTEGGDAGIPLVVSHPDLPASKAITEVATTLAARSRSVLGRSLPLSVS